MSPEIILLNLAGIFILGIGAQWLSWKLHFPAILALLAAGFVAGPITGLIDPDKVLGEALFPVVSLSVGIILFEGGLSLEWGEMQDVRRSLRNLLTIGWLITWFLSTLAAYYLLEFPLSLALLLGAILVVTGPTVVTPLLQQIRPIGKVGTVARWEGIIIDPIGAVLAVLVFEVSISLSGHHGGWTPIAAEILSGIFWTLLTGGGLGIVGAILLIVMMRKFWIPDSLHNPVVLMIVVAVFSVSNYFQHESGLLAVTLMGIILANQHYVSIGHIIEFKENVSVILISSLFILLAARIRPDAFTGLDWRAAVFVALLILLVRPISVLASTIRSNLKRNERLFLAWLAPRGIVAAAVTSVFALRLQDQTEVLELVEPSRQLAPIVFVVIIATVAVYGLTAFPLARLLGLATVNPQGILFASAHPAVRAIAKTLKSADVTVLLVDVNRANIQTAKLEGIPTYHANILSGDLLEKIDLGGIGRFLAMTRNDEVNAFAALHFSEVFSRKDVYQLVPDTKGAGVTGIGSHHLYGRLLFDPNATYSNLDERFEKGAVVKKNKLTKEFDYAAFKEYYGESAMPLFLISSTGQVTVCTASDPPKPQVGQTLISLVYPVDEEKKKQEEKQKQSEEEDREPEST